jgi:SAM-dependent methyltransferase
VSDRIVLGWVPQPMGGMSVLQQGFVDSMYGFITHDSQHRKLFAGYTHASSGYIPASRNEIVSAFLKKTDADWLLMMDWDVNFGPEAPYQLLDAADPIERPIISGVYVTFFGDDNALRPCWMAEADGQEYVPVSGFEVDQVVPLTVCGMGFTLMHRSVFETLAKEHEGDSWLWFGHDIVNGSRCGEDLTFCARARAAGFSVWGHGGVLLGHTKAKTLTPLDMERDAFASHDPSRESRSVLNIGGGSKDIPLPPEFEGWNHVLLDVDRKPGVDLVMDARDLAEYEDYKESFDAVYMSHSLEHFYAHEVQEVLAGALFVLKEGGTIIVKVPDVGGVARAIAEGADLGDVAYESPAGPVTWRDMIYGFGKEIEGGNNYYAHKTGFTLVQLREALEAAGFVNVMVMANPQTMELEARASKG